jgi:histidine ammonia-lyase
MKPEAKQVHLVGVAAAKSVEFGDAFVTINDIVAIAQGRARARLSSAPDFLKQIDDGVQFLDRLLEEDGVIYGVTTGVGDSCTVTVPADLVEELPVHLTRFHGCGMGEHFSRELSIATLATRLASLVRGFSGVGIELLRQFEALINRDIAPMIPQEGRWVPAAISPPYPT